MELISVELLRGVLALAFVAISVVFFAMSIFFGYKYFDGLMPTKKSVNVSFIFLSLFGINFLVAYVVYALPPIEQIVLMILLFVFLMLGLYVCALFSIVISEKVIDMTHRMLSFLYKTAIEKNKGR